MTVQQRMSRDGSTGRQVHGFESWRRCCLVRAGFDPALATSVATEPGIDLHALLQLIDRGCPPELAARIMSPVPTEVTR